MLVGGSDPCSIGTRIQCLVEGHDWSIFFVFFAVTDGREQMMESVKPTAVLMQNRPKFISGEHRSAAEGTPSLTLVKPDRSYGKLHACSQMSEANGVSWGFCFHLASGVSHYDDQSFLARSRL